RRSCFSNTRTKILEDVQKWASDPNSTHGYWICGMAGTGKSTIAVSTCEHLNSKGTLAGSFFCSRQIPECQKYQSIIPTLAYQLGGYSRRFAIQIRGVLTRYPDIASKKPEEQVLRLLIEPWQELIKTAGMNTKFPVMVLDALDECQDVQVALKPLIDALQGKKLPGMKFFFTSRPKGVIEQLMHSNTGPVEKVAKIKELILHQVEETEVQKDIYIYVESELNNIASDMQLERLTKLSGKLFIYAATIVKFVKNAAGYRQQERLVKSLDQSRKSEDLDQLYTDILQEAISDKTLDQDEQQQDWKILHTVISVRKPLTCKAIAELLSTNEYNLNENIVMELIERLHAVCYISDENQSIYTFHLSFPEFIVAYIGKPYYATEQHLDLSFTCFRILERLRFNICGLMSSSVADEKVEDLPTRIKNNIGESLGYCCQFWTDHVIKAHSKESIALYLDKFVMTKGLFWIEAMSLMKALPRCGEMLELIGWIPSVAFSPNGTRVVSGSEDSTIRIWDVFTSTQIGDPLLGHDDSIFSVAFSFDGNRIVSGSKDGTVRIWNATTGNQIGNPLYGHGYYVHTVAFSPDGTRIVSGSGDVRIWDATTGVQIGIPLYGHDGPVYSVAFSPDGTQVASGSVDCSVRIWDVITVSQSSGFLPGHEFVVLSVAFSPDGSKILSLASDKTVKVWDANTGNPIGDPLYGHDDYVNLVGFSSTGSKIVSGSSDKTMRIWNATTGVQIGAPLHGHDNYVASFAFSPDETRMVLGYDDGIIEIWDATSGTLIGNPLLGHDDCVHSVAFSPDGTVRRRIVSGSHDKTVRIWDTTGAQIGDPLHGHDDYVQSVVFALGGKRIVSGSADCTVRIWDATTGTQIGNPLDHSGYVIAVASSSDRTKIVSGSSDETIRIWDVTTGNQIGHPFQSSGDDAITSVAFSPDGTKIVSGSSRGIIRIWDATISSLTINPLFDKSSMFL
ncbi:hypothetical protein GYMLUDRAFT_995037, partial [Collybiopsis luxurians FD-317 M1]